MSRASAAGVTWTSRTAEAEWAARAYHTSVVDAAGAIYVIGGRGNGAVVNRDVWVSTDGGARAGLVPTVVTECWVGMTGMLRGYYKDSYGVLRGTTRNTGYSIKCPRGTAGHYEG